MYNLIALFHLFAVIVFLGNIITEIRWMHKASKTRDKEVIRFAITEVIKGDTVFTLPGVFLIIATGSFLYSNFSLADNRWILFALISFICSGIIYTVKVAPLQKKIAQLVSDTSPTLSANYKKAYTAWNFWGWIALSTSVLALIFITLKIPQ